MTNSISNDRAGWESSWKDRVGFESWFWDISNCWWTCCYASECCSC